MRNAVTILFAMTKGNGDVSRSQRQRQVRNEALKSRAARTLSKSALQAAGGEVAVVPQNLIEQPLSSAVPPSNLIHVKANET